MAACSPSAGPPSWGSTDDCIALARHVSRRYSSPGLERDDLTQGALLALLQSRPHYDPLRHGTLQAYLTVCMRHALWLMVQRDGREAHERLPPNVFAVAPEPGDAYEQAHSALLTPRQRQVLQLFLAGLDAAQIGVAIGITSGAVRALVRASADVLRQAELDAGRG
jgi:RNA polymerase sigma factor (sigma-70 family)